MTSKINVPWLLYMSCGVGIGGRGGDIGEGGCTTPLPLYMWWPAVEYGLSVLPLADIGLEEGTGGGRVTWP